ncbi:MAG: hypothetical protein R2781_04490 [Flavobacteriaceae bacterium]
MMNPILQNILAVLAGIIIGGAVNMGIVMLGPSIIPPPEGVDTATMEGLQAGMHLFTAKHFITPFLAHALGTLVGAFIASKIAVSHKMRFALGLGTWFLIGGIMAAYMLRAPMWYNVVDLVLAYIPMAYLGGKIAIKKTS